MDTLEQNPDHKNDYSPEALVPFPVQEEYAPVIFAQDTVSHIISFDMLSGKVFPYLDSVFFCQVVVIHSSTVLVDLTENCAILIKTACHPVVIQEFLFLFLFCRGDLSKTWMVEPLSFLIA